MNQSMSQAHAVIAGLLAAGVRHIVFAPGSRSAPLVYAVAAQSSKQCATYVRIDEREAAFLALGIAKGLRARGCGAPVAVVTTSGTAVANVHPAITEAAYTGLPIIALTADRPAVLRGTGANQTLDRQDLVLPEVTSTWDIPVFPSSAGTPEWGKLAADVAHMVHGATVASTAGPVHMNVQFAPPLVPDLPVASEEPVVSGTSPEPELLPIPEIPLTRGETVRVMETGAKTAPVTTPVPEQFMQELTTLVRHNKTVFLAGDCASQSFPVDAWLAWNIPAPILAEPSSPFFTTDSAISRYETLLTSSDVPYPEAVIVLGKPTLGRATERLLRHSDVLRRDIPAAALSSQTTSPQVTSLPGTWVLPPGTYGEWNEEERAWVEAWEEPGSPSEAGHIYGVLRTMMKQDGHIFAANSSAIRYFSQAAPPASQRRATIHASRGVSGIDGLISTALGLTYGLSQPSQGLSHPRPPQHPMRLVIGDIAFLHGIGGLWLEQGETLPPLDIIVLNNNGGAIFSHLENGAEHVRPLLKRFFATEQSVDIRSCARAYSWDYEVADSEEKLLALLRKGDPQSAHSGRVGGRIIEVTLDEDGYFVSQNTHDK